MKDNKPGTSGGPCENESKMRVVEFCDERMLAVGKRSSKTSVCTRRLR